MSKKNKLIEIVAEILECEVEEVSLETELDEAVWDSLAIVSFMAEADSEFGKTLSPTEVGAVKSVKDLLDLI
jgi:acyl carrier protein